MNDFCNWRLNRSEGKENKETKPRFILHCVLFFGFSSLPSFHFPKGYNRMEEGMPERIKEPK